MKKSVLGIAPRNTGTYQHRVLIGTPTMGTVRIEWHNAVNGLVIPTNWSNSTQTPIGYLTHDGQNIIAKEALDRGFKWALFLEDDTVPPPDLLVRLNAYLEKPPSPLISALYVLKGSNPPEPLMYRGRGTGAFHSWKPGTKVWVDGVPTGCLLVHVSVLRELAKTAPEYQLQNNGQRVALKRIFNTPRHVDGSQGSYQKLVGTSDLDFCDRILKGGILKKIGWRGLVGKRYPFLVDTRIICGHIDRTTGGVYYP